MAGALTLTKVSEIFILSLSLIISSSLLFMLLAIPINIWPYLNISLLAFFNLFFLIADKPFQRLKSNLVLLLFLVQLSSVVTIITNRFINLSPIATYFLILAIFLLLYFIMSRFIDIRNRIDFNLLESANIFLIITFIHYYDFGNLCKTVGLTDFDSQNFLTWDYTAVNNWLLYKDIFYYYGALHYFESSSVVAKLIYLLSTSTIFTVAFITLRSIIKSKILIYLSLFPLILIADYYSGVITFNRYGLIIIFSISIAYLFHKNLFFSAKSLILLGLFTGFMFITISYQGIYNIILIFASFLLFPFIKLRSFGLTFFKNIINKIPYLIWYLIGIVLGALPWIIYLLNNHILADFLASFIKITPVKEFTQLYLYPYLTTKEQLFVNITIAIGVFLLTLKVFFGKIYLTYSTYLQLSLTITLILLNQKNLMRPMAGQLMFIAALLSITYLADFFELLKKRQINTYQIKIYFITLFYIFIIIIFPQRYITTFMLDHKNNYLYNTPKIITKKITIENTETCLKNNFKAKNLPINELQIKVREFMNQQQGFNGKIYSLPFEPIFYIIFTQKPPPYFTLYESSPLFAQKEIIKYIEKEQIDYIVYNTSAREFDFVPNYLRGVTLYKYILNNYTVDSQLGNYLILKRHHKQIDFFESLQSVGNPDLETYLLNVNLGHLPRSEGIYKNNLLASNSDVIFKGESIAKVNAYLSKNTIFSSNLFLILTSKNSLPSTRVTTKLSISTKNSLKTSITFNSCDLNQPCIINISNIPLFYFEKVIVNISMDTPPDGSIKLVRMKDKNIKIMW